MSKRYAAPPIVEAVCEFRLTPDTTWDLVVPGLFYEKVKGTFPKREQRIVQQIDLTPGPTGLQQQIRTSERILFFTEDMKKIAQIGPRLLVINVLKPYPSWDGFKPLIEIGWSSLKDVAEIRGIERIGLRYINRVELPAQNVDLSKYFEFYPFVGRRLPQQMISFLTGAEFSYADDRDHCRVQLAPAPGAEGKSIFMLDIDYFLTRPRGIEIADAIDWVEEAHKRVEEIFEGCISNTLREMFKEVK
ncbi:MAG: TIGR04255 family protein [Methanothrix sp.]|uniref:TIGR04255 family protein n=1 Tax=Methanothrix sp. TaxID=90426 RepID=UPI0032AF94CE|nr:TIGR04255 family protein [Methanothrix sp.]